MNSKVQIKTDTDGIDFDQVSELLAQFGLSNLDGRTQKKVFENSYAKVFIIASGEVIGVGRAISDGYTQAAIYNIAIRKDFQGKGYGKRVLDELLKQVEGCNVVLYTHPKHIGLYEHWGFSKLKTGYALFPNEEHYRAEGFF